MAKVTFEDLVQGLATAIGNVWAAEWGRADFCYTLTKHFDKKQLNVLAGQVGRSHQDLYRWSRLAERFPPETRAQDRSPREHARWMREEMKREGPAQVLDKGKGLESPTDQTSSKGVVRNRLAEQDHLAQPGRTGRLRSSDSRTPARGTRKGKGSKGAALHLGVQPQRPRKARPQDVPPSDDRDRPISEAPLVRMRP